MRTLQPQTRGNNKPVKTAFEVEGSPRMDFRKVNMLSPQLGPWHLGATTRTNQSEAGPLQERAKFQDTDQESLLSSEVLSDLFQSILINKFLLEHSEL